MYTFFEYIFLLFIRFQLSVLSLAGWFFKSDIDRVTRNKQFCQKFPNFLFNGFVFLWQWRKEKLSLNIDLFFSIKLFHDSTNPDERDEMR